MNKLHEWEPHDGKAQPYRNDTRVKVQIRAATNPDGSLNRSFAESQPSSKAKGWIWTHRGPDHPGDILWRRRAAPGEE